MYRSSKIRCEIIYTWCFDSNNSFLKNILTLEVVKCSWTTSHWYSKEWNQVQAISYELVNKLTWDSVWFFWYVCLLVNWTFQIKSYLPLTEHKGVFFCISGSCYTFFNLCSQFLKGNRITKNGTGPEKVCRVLYIYICVSSPFVRMSHSTQSVYAHHIFWGIYFSCFLGSFYQGSLIILPLNGKYFCPHSRHASFYNSRLVFKEK